MAKRNKHCRAGWWILGGLLVVVGLAVAQFLFAIKGKGWSGIDPNYFGDSFGAMNAIISGIAFVAFIYTLIMQRNELQLQREDLEETRKELQGSRKAQEEQVRMSYQSTRIASLTTILNFHRNQLDWLNSRNSISKNETEMRNYVYIKMNQLFAELEAENTAVHFSQEPWNAANEMLHQAAIRAGNAEEQHPIQTYPADPHKYYFQLDDLRKDLPRDNKEALLFIRGLLDQSSQINSRYQAANTEGPCNNHYDPLKPVVIAWLSRAKECLELGIQRAKIDSLEAAEGDQ